jgi:hypothetical protein
LISKRVGDSGGQSICPILSAPRISLLVISALHGEILPLAQFLSKETGKLGPDVYPLGSRSVGLPSHGDYVKWSLRMPTQGKEQISIYTYCSAYLTKAWRCRGHICAVFDFDRVAKLVSSVSATNVERYNHHCWTLGMLAHDPFLEKETETVAGKFGHIYDVQ